MRQIPLIVAITCALHASAARAQAQADVMFVGETAIAAAHVDHRPGEVEQRSLTVSANPHPIRLGASSTLLSVGASFNHTIVDLDSGAALTGEPSRRHLNAIDARVGFVQLLNERWFISGGVVPGLRSDLEQPLRSDDLQVAGYLLGGYVFNQYPRLTLQFGVVGQTHSTIVPVLPVLGLDYLSDQFVVDLGVSGVNAVARLGSRLELGVFGSFDASWYHVRPAPTGEASGASSLWLTNIVAGPQINVRPFGDIWLSARAGYTVTRILRFGNSERETLDELSRDPQRTFVAQLGISYGPRPQLGSGR